MMNLVLQKNERWSVIVRIPLLPDKNLCFSQTKIALKIYRNPKYIFPPTVFFDSLVICVVYNLLITKDIFTFPQYSKSSVETGLNIICLRFIAFSLPPSG